MHYKNYKLGIIILNYGDPQLCLNLVKSLIKTKEKFNIVIVDNFSTKNNLKKLEYFITNCKHNFIYLKKSKNLGYGVGNNLGLKMSFEKLKSEYSLVLNPDIILKKNCSFSSLKILKKNEKCLFTGIVNENDKNKSLYKFNKLTLRLSSYNKKESNSIQPIIPSGSCIGFTKKLWKDFGGFSENYFLYFEELDLIYRFHKKYKNFPIIKVLESIKLNHLQGGTMGIDKTASVDYWSSRSRIIFLKIHFIWYLPIGLFYNLIKIFHRFLSFKFINIKSLLLGTFSGICFTYKKK
jgi:GT2 family glycosyltransferase